MSGPMPCGRLPARLLHRATGKLQRLLEEALPLFREGGREREVVFTLSELAFMALRRHEPERGCSL